MTTNDELRGLLRLCERTGAKIECGSTLTGAMEITCTTHGEPLPRLQ